MVSNRFELERVLSKEETGREHLNKKGRIKNVMDGLLLLFK